MLKRYHAHELGESASRRVGYHAKAEYAKSGRSRCVKCQSAIPDKELRLALMLQDDEGYKSACWLHFTCFWKHPETKKLYRVTEIIGQNTLKKADRDRIETSFDEMRATVTPKKTKKAPTTKRKAANGDDGDGDDKKKAKIEPLKVKPAKNLVEKVVNCVEILNHVGTKAGLPTLKKALTEHYQIDVAKQATALKKAMATAVETKKLLKFKASYVHPAEGDFKSLSQGAWKTWEMVVLGGMSYREWAPAKFGAGASTTDHGTHEKALKEMEKLVKEKVKKGYVVN
eukprot:m.16010 g.16010  ORF g.16010 m.16010 type:complete len:285 (-) comp10832_c0_seq1:127-981(-)